MKLFSIDESSLQAGDHIYSFRNAHIYSHHGIYVGENRVIHFTRTGGNNDDDDDHIKKIKKSSNYRCEDCGYNPKKRIGVVKSCLDCFHKDHRLFRFEYGVSSKKFLLSRRTGTCSTGSCIYSLDEVVRRATDMLNSVEGFGDYILLENNCETFAVFCKTGKRVSLQAFSMKNKGIIAFKDFTSQSFSLKNTATTMFNLAVTQKFDTLRYDIRVHQQDYDGDDR
ncbi:protein LEAD-SENSITIVE 1 [Cannabis sativa]|uniref:LRAT domain-containing protein n=1 Tax=Cannabis sativa TaxID=3483 RepID=A0A7J6E9T3_CANSA|nr:protein LEAD-SENSITIVE 1 [Cannabis sativa]KAF4355187.1 hypothetical protein F8388_012962 [Cannabis sativa]KAF4393719.1 hypothetical protein G4B88_007705 [Cannabis sativa]